MTHPQSSQSRLPSSMERTPVRFSVYELDSHAGELRKHGIKVRLQNKPLRILELLLERPGEVVTRDQLRETLWPPNVYVDFDHSLNSAVNKLREALGDSAAQPRFIETLPRGYRFIASVSEPAIHVPAPVIHSGHSTPQADADVERQQAGNGVAFWRRTGWVAGIVVGALGLVALGGLLTLQLGALTSSSQLALAVLPFQNLSADPEQEFFSEGFTDELIAHVGRLAPDQLRVIARASAIHDKRTNKTVDQIGRELGVEYLLKGASSAPEPACGSRVNWCGSGIRRTSGRRATSAACGMCWHSRPTSLVPSPKRSRSLSSARPDGRCRAGRTWIRTSTKRI